MSLVFRTLIREYAGIPILKQAIFSMEVTELTHNAIDGIMLSQLLMLLSSMLMTFVYCLYHYFIATRMVKI